MQTLETRSRALWAVAALVAVLLVALVAAVAYLAGRDSGRDDGAVPARMEAQAAALQQGCRDWGGGPAPMRAQDAWCTDLTDWMLQAMRTDGTGPQMMWGDTDRLRSSCREWVTHLPADDPPLDDPGAWCDQMVAWMDEHMSTWSGRRDWDDWMMHGSMMR